MRGWVQTSVLIADSMGFLRRRAGRGASFDRSGAVRLCRTRTGLTLREQTRSCRISSRKRQRRITLNNAMSITPRSPDAKAREKVKTWVTSQWKLSPLRGQLSSEAADPMRQERGPTRPDRAGSIPVSGAQPVHLAHQRRPGQHVADKLQPVSSLIRGLFRGALRRVVEAGRAA